VRSAFLILLGVMEGCLPGVAQTHLVQKFDGTSTTTTPTFTVGDKWEVVWNSPVPLRITLLSADGTIVAGTAGMFRGSFYQPKGGTYYLQVNGAMNGPMPHWQLSVEEVGNATADGPLANGGPEMNFVPPSVMSPAAATQTVANPETPSVTPGATTPLAPKTNLTDDQLRAVVTIEGDNVEGTGFLVKTPDGPAVVTNLHVLAANPNIRILTNTGAQITTLGLKGASDRDLALLPVKDAGYSYLDMDADVSSNVQPGDEVITPGNSEGGGVVLNTHGSVVAVGPDRVEFSNPIYHGNSGGPVFHPKSGKVLAVVTEAVKVDTSNELDKASFGSANSGITQSMRYFGLRLDTVPHWDNYDPAQFQVQTTFLEQFHQQSRRLDSYLNSSEKTDNQAGKDDENGPPSSKLYLTDDKIVKAHDTFIQNANGGDASQRLDAFRQWLFTLTNLADTDLAAIQASSNFYGVEQERAREELDYRKAIKKELDSFGDDITRAESLGFKN
jgi:S1-C subfamily serine protease